MKTHKTRDRVEQTLRWMLALALIAAVAWAWAQSGGSGWPGAFSG
ncbi:hypothetical protein [Lysobacter niastensis]|nr:hypothetical protein [Lysobacter niastensis]